MLMDDTKHIRQQKWVDPPNNIANFQHVQIKKVADL